MGVPQPWPRPWGRRSLLRWHVRPSALLGAALVAALLLARHAGTGATSRGGPLHAEAFLAPGRAGARRSALVGALGLALAPAVGRAEVLPERASSPSQPWRQEIPETLEILRDLQGRWPEIEKQGTIGGRRVQKVLDYTLVENLTISVPSGEPVGATFRRRDVTSVTRPELGWSTKDQVLMVNDKKVINGRVLKKVLDEADGRPLKFLISRRRQSPIDGIEEDLVQAYMKVDSTGLPELDEVVSHLNAARVLATSASGSGRSSGEMLEELKDEIDALVPDFEKIVKAIG